MSPKSLSKLEIIASAACHTCCARIGEPCTFTASDDPKLLRAVAKQSHLARIQLARKRHAEEISQNPLDSISLIL